MLNTKTCTITNCNKPIKCKGLCKNHYEKSRKKKIKEFVNNNYPKSNEMYRHKAKLKKEKKLKEDRERVFKNQYKLTQFQQFIFISIAFANINKCSIWPYGRSNYKNYQEPNRMSYKGKVFPPPRLSLILSKGEPKDKSICAHDPIRCNNSLCVNPFHLRWATVQENVNDMAIAGTILNGEKNPQSKITEADAKNIINDKRSVKLISQDYPISETMVYFIKSGKRWSYLERNN